MTDIAWCNICECVSTRCWEAGGHREDRKYDAIILKVSMNGLQEDDMQPDLLLGVPAPTQCTRYKDSWMQLAPNIMSMMAELRCFTQLLENEPWFCSSFREIRISLALFLCQLFLLG